MIDETAARLVDAETGQRGYVLSGNEAYLEPYREAMKSLDQTMGQLRDLTSYEPNQRKHIQALEPLVEKKLAELQLSDDEEKYLSMNSDYLYRKQQAWQDELTNQLRRVVPQPQLEKA